MRGVPLKRMITWLVIVLLLGVVVGRTRTDSRAPRAGARTAQGGDPCAHLDYMRSVHGMMERYDWSVESFVNESEVVAKAEIEAVDTPRFNTSTGGPPPPLPTDATEDELEEYPDQILAAVALRATQIYSGSQVTGYVVLRWGGSSPDCPDYAYESEPQLMTGDVYDEGMAFLGEPTDPVLINNPPPWLQYLWDYRDQLNSDPMVHYDAMLLHNWYKYEGTEAVSALQPESLMPIEQLEAEVEAATGGS